MTQLNVVIYDDAAKVASLREAWDQVLGGAAQYSAAQAYDYFVPAWVETAKIPGARLAVVTVWNDGVLAAVWPLFVHCERFYQVTCHIGTESFQEYSGPLVRADADAPQVLRAAIDAAKGLGDLLKVYNVRAPSPEADALAGDRANKHPMTVGSPVMTLTGYVDFEAWMMSKSKNFRAALRNDRRRLAGVGEVKFLEMSGPVDGNRFIDWIYASKRQWLDERGIGASWIRESHGENIFRALAVRTPDQRAARGDTEFYALTLDDKIIAAGIGMSSSDRIEFFVSAFDPEYSYYSPGNQLIQDYATLALQSGRDFDFRITHEAYKLRWIDRYDRFDSFYLACTPLGEVALRFEQTRLRIRAFRARWGPIIKGKLGLKQAKPSA
jgi:CelD/BcsL family acetyltransferase involved in cellulose biosynthesis